MLALRSSLPLSLALVIAGAASAQTATFQMIPDAYSANDLTPDGRYVVGGLNNGRAYIFDTLTQQMTLLPPECNQAVAVSDDATVVLGNIEDPKTGDEVAAIWTAASGVWTSLGYLPTAGSCPSRSSAYELSADGSVAVGLSWVDGCDGRGFRWTQATGMIELEGLANGANRASVVSGNGNLIGGFAQGSFTRTPAIWGAGGDGSLLDPPNGDAVGEVFGLNEAGTILVGNWNGKAVRWTQGGTVHTQIGSGSALPGWTGIAMDIANNWTTVGFDNLGVNRRAWIQVNGTGPIIDLSTYLNAHGAGIGEDTLLEVCQAISNDGSVIVGHTGFVGAWIAHVTGTNTCPADLSPPGGDGMVSGADLAFLLGDWGGSTADLDGDGVTNAADLAILLGGWGDCPAAVGACCTGTDCDPMTAAECAALGGLYLGDNVPCTGSACANNDACANAIDITDLIDQGYILGDNSTATPGWGMGPDPELPADSPSCQWSGSPGAAHSTVWYKFTAPFLGLVTIRLCDSVAAPFSDSILSLYSGSCGNLVEVGCNEDGCGFEPAYPYYSSLTVEGLVPGQTYYLCVANTGGWFGSVPGAFKLTITSP